MRSPSSRDAPLAAAAADVTPRPSERFEHATLAMSLVSLDGVLRHVNDALVRLLGHCPEQLVGAPVDRMDRTGALEAALEAAREGLAGGEVEHVATTADGRPVHLRTAWTLLRDESGRPWYVTFIHVDESARVAAEQASATAEARWRALLAHAADLTWVADADGVLLEVSPGRLAQQLAWPIKQVVGVSAFSFLHPDDRTRFVEAFGRVVSGEAAQEVLECRIGRRDGEWVWVRQTVTDLRDDPSVGAIVGNVVDVSERRRAERERAREAARLRARFEQSALPQATVDNSGRLTAVNDAYCALVGRSREQLVGCLVADTHHPDDTAEGDAVLARVLAGEEESAQYERLALAADGSALPLLIDLSLVRDEHGQPDGVAAFLHDLRPLRESERRRERQEQFFGALNDLASDLALVADAEGSLLYASPAVTALFGYDMVELVAMADWEFVHPDDVERASQEFLAVVEDGVTRTFRLRIRTADGAWRHVEETVQNMLHSSIGALVCNLRDVTERVEAEQALRISEERYRTIADTAQEGIWAVSPKGWTLYANARMAEILGVPLQDLYDRHMLDMLDQREGSATEERISARAATGNERYEISYVHPDGGERRLQIAAAPLYADDGTLEGSLGMVSDVTEARRAERELQHAALNDALTGLPNRALLLDRIEHAVDRQTTSTAVLFLDLDQFKLVNDSRGHGAGDELLVEVAARLRAAARLGDTVARFGGDEFVVVCEDTSVDEAQAVAAALLAALDEPMEMGTEQARVTASVGIAVSPPGSASDLLRFADTAMYAAKAAGHGAVRVFEPGLAREAEERWTLATDVRTALHEKAFDLHYQPFVDLATGAVVGMEALARWTHPVHGQVAPDRFLPVAEMAGLTNDFDRWAMRTALDEAGRLRRRGAVPADTHVSVNVTPRTLGDQDLPAQLLSWAAEAGLPPEHVALEIVEGSLLRGTDRAVEHLHVLRGHGFGVTIDDFGTGYSSLSYLRGLPVNSLKIDRSFVADITSDPDALAIVVSIVDLANAVGVSTVAEGVETAEQAAVLRGLGCPVGQGWLWSPAVSADEIRAGTWTAGYGVEDAVAPRAAAPARRRPAPASEPVGAEHGLAELLSLHREGASLATIAAALNRDGFRTPTGLRWHRTSVARVVADAAYPSLTGPAS